MFLYFYLSKNERRVTEYNYTLHVLYLGLVLYFKKTERTCVLFSRLCGFEPFFDPRGDQYMYSRILNCDYEFVSPWWDEVSLNAKDLVSESTLY